MKAKVQKWGNSLALRIPKVLALEARIDPDSVVELSLLDGVLTVAPAVSGALSLGSLLTGITQDNLHAEWETGPAVGLEEW